jgi:hypothetical protein
VSMGYLTPMLRLGTSKALQLEDLGRLHTNDESSGIQEKFEALWAAEKARPAPHKPALINVTFAFAGRRALLIGFLLPCMVTALQLAPPILSKRLINFMAGQVEMAVLEQALTVAAMGLALAGSTTIMAVQQKMMLRIGIHLRTALCAMIFRKSLTVDMAQHGAATGDIVTLMSTDAQTFQHFLAMIPPLLTAPVMVGACLALA